MTALPAPAVAVAGLYDVHGNLPALDAVLAEAGDATLVFGGDLAAGPMPAEALDRIMGLDALVLHGNADRQLLIGPSDGLIDEWMLKQLEDRHREYLAALPEQIELDVDGLGRVLFCHGSPRSDEEMILKTTPDGWLREMLEGVEADVVVCGHTHMQFDRGVDRWRVVNAGSVGLAYGAPGAHWVLLGPDVEHRQTPYDSGAFAEHVKTLEWSIAERFAEENILATPSEQEVLEFFEGVASRQRAERYPGRA